MREEKEAEDAPPRGGPAECVAAGGIIGGFLIRRGSVRSGRSQGWRIVRLRDEGARHVRGWALWRVVRA